MPDPYKIVINAVQAQPIILAPQPSTGQKMTILQGPITIYGTQLVPATANTLGGVIVGSNLSITGNGVLSANIPVGSLQIATNTTLGGIIVGSGLLITGNGVLSTTTVNIDGGSALSTGVGSFDGGSAASN